jgi:hypothetical protein
LKRGTIRAQFERRFTAERMAKDYLAAYHRLPALRKKSHLEVLAVPENESVIRMPIPSVGLEIGAASAG